jgi:membrane protease YdiL (CAAX protease family)
MKKNNQKAVNNSSRKTARITIFLIWLIYVAWIGAWVIEQAIESHSVLLSTSRSRFFYWLGMKLLFWILPALFIIRVSKQKNFKVMELKRLPSAIIWGVGSGLIIGVISVITKLFTYQPIFSFSLSWSLLGGVIVTPILEEILFRGAVLPALKQQYSFIIANCITSLLFLGIHLPGWYFQGRLLEKLTSPVSGAFSVFLLGLVLGYVAHKSKTAIGSILAHILNNFFNA